MKIAFVLAGGLHPSGREQMTPAILHLLEHLARAHEVHAFAVRHLPQPTSYTLRGIHVHDLGRPRDRGAFGRWSELRPLLAEMTKHGRFDVVHGYQADPGVLAAFAGRRFGIPSVVTCDSGEFVAIPEIEYGMQRSLRTRWLVRTACRLASRVHVCTAFMESLAAERGYGAVRIPIGVEVSVFSGIDARADGPPWRLLTVGSINRVKDHRTLLDALAIASREIDVSLDIVGEDTLDGSIQAHAAQLGLADRVTFHGYRPFDELPSFHRAAHLYVQSSRHEAAAAAVMEAAASGLPIVGTRVGYVADWSPGGAIAVDAANPSALARAIVNTLRDRALRSRIAATARAFSLTHDVAWTARELERLYISNPRKSTRYLNPDT